MTAGPLDHFRAFERIASTAALSLSPLGGTHEQAVTLVDVGLGGLCFEAAGAFEPGQRLRLELDLPRLWDRLTVHAEIVWVKERAPGTTRVGVKFTRPSGRTLRVLAENLAGD